MPRRSWTAALSAVALATAGAVTVLSAAPASASVPAHPKFKSSAPFGIWNDGGYDIYNNEWNTNEAGPQTIWGNSFQNWGVESSQSDSTSVKTYPSVQKNYNERPYTSIKLLRSLYTEQMPAAGGRYDAEFAYDLWLNDNAIEVMMWLDNHGQRPAGDVVAHVTFYGQKFALWRANDTFSFALVGKNQQSGTVHLMSALRYLVNHHMIPESARLNQVNAGWEVCNTHGAKDFTMSRFRVWSQHT
jgi:hypothetical protein